jgi:hypothetical protein
MKISVAGKSRRIPRGMQAVVRKLVAAQEEMSAENASERLGERKVRFTRGGIRLESEG